MSTLTTTIDALNFDNASLMSVGMPSAISSTMLSPTDRRWTPPVDITETPHAFRITMDLAGLSSEDAVVQVADGIITVQGQRRRPVGDGPEKSHRSERVYGSFARSFLLPENANKQKISLDYKEGVLSVVISKLQPGRYFKVAEQDIYEIWA